MSQSNRSNETLGKKTRATQAAPTSAAAPAAAVRAAPAQSVDKKSEKKKNSDIQQEAQETPGQEHITRASQISSKDMEETLKENEFLTSGKTAIIGKIIKSQIWSRLTFGLKIPGEAAVQNKVKEIMKTYMRALSLKIKREEEVEALNIEKDFTKWLQVTVVEAGLKTAGLTLERDKELYKMGCLASVLTIGGGYMLEKTETKKSPVTAVAFEEKEGQLNLVVGLNDVYKGDYKFEQRYGLRDNTVTAQDIINLKIKTLKNAYKAYKDYLRQHKGKEEEALKQAAEKFLIDSFGKNDAAKALSNIGYEDPGPIENLKAALKVLFTEASPSIMEKLEKINKNNCILCYIPFQTALEQSQHAEQNVLQYFIKQKINKLLLEIQRKGNGAGAIQERKKLEENALTFFKDKLFPMDSKELVMGVSMLACKNCFECISQASGPIPLIRGSSLREFPMQGTENINAIVRKACESLLDFSENQDQSQEKLSQFSKRILKGVKLDVGIAGKASPKSKPADRNKLKERIPHATPPSSPKATPSAPTGSLGAPQLAAVHRSPKPDKTDGASVVALDPKINGGDLAGAPVAAARNPAAPTPALRPIPSAIPSTRSNHAEILPLARFDIRGNIITPVAPIAPAPAPAAPAPAVQPFHFAAPAPAPGRAPPAPAPAPGRAPPAPAPATVLHLTASISDAALKAYSDAYNRTEEARKEILKGVLKELAKTVGNNPPT